MCEEVELQKTEREKEIKKQSERGAAKEEVYL